MIEKRFHKGYVLGDTGLIDEQKGEWFIENINNVYDLKKNWDKVIDKLNEVNDEKEQLKQIVGFLKNDNAKDIVEVLNLQQTEIWKVKRENQQLKQFQNKVFERIDDRIAFHSHKPYSTPMGMAMSVNFDADVDRLARLSELEELKRELQGDLE